MERLIKEYLDLTGEEKEKYDYVRGMLSNLVDELKKEVAYPSFSDLLIDTEHLLEHMNVYIRRYYESHL